MFIPYGLSFVSSFEAYKEVHLQNQKKYWNGISIWNEWIKEVWPYKLNQK
jgi:hypothetical protein